MSRLLIALQSALTNCSKTARHGYLLFAITEIPSVPLTNDDATKQFSFHRLAFNRFESLFIRVV